MPHRPVPWWRGLFGLRSVSDAPLPAPTPDTDTGATEGPALGVVKPRVLAEIERRRQEIAGTVSSLQSVTEREVLSCGNVLSEILENVRGLIADNEKTMAQALARTDELTSKYAAQMQSDVQKQEATVARALALAKDIERAIQDVGALTRTSNILAINAKIESARLGDSGRVFSTIASQIGELSRSIVTAMASVTEAIGSVREGLPQLGETAVSMRDGTKQFIQNIERQVKSTSFKDDQATTGGGQLDRILDLSNEALSHLQFHDPLVQKLAGVNRSLDALAHGTARLLEGEVDAGPEQIVQEPAGEEPPPGDIVFF
jgi:uncharacterized protein YoxC